MTKIVNPTPPRKPVNTLALPDFVTNVKEAIAPHETIESLIIALSNLISDCEISSRFREAGTREHLRIIILFHNELVIQELGAKAASYVTRLFERDWATYKDFKMTRLLCALNLAIKDQVFSGRRIDEEERRQLDLIRQVRNHLIKKTLGKPAWDLSKSLLS